MTIQDISISEFYMWRTLFAVAHTDGIVTDEEIRFMAEALEDIPFSEEQRATLNEDITTPQDVVSMFMRIGEQKDQAKFFSLARKLVWIDGDYGMQEQNVMLKLEQMHLSGVDVRALAEQSLDLEFESEDGDALPQPPPREEQEKRQGYFRSIISAFRRTHRD